MPEWELVYYTTATGGSPVREFLDGLGSNDAMRVSYELDLLERFGIQLGMPHVRRLQSSELWELRVRGGTDYRIFYVAITGRRFVLLHGFRKQSQRTPRREIRVAEQRLTDFRDRNRT